jgi:hypothetical protein
MKFRSLSICTLAVVFCTIARAQITGVTAGTDLTGGGTSGNVTLNLDTTKVPQLKKANTFTGNQTVTGNVSASGTVNGESYLIGGKSFAFGSVANGNAFLGFAGNSAPTNTGTANTGVGVGSLVNNSTGGGNTAAGEGALYYNTFGSGNTAVGAGSGGGNYTGNFNTFLGYNTRAAADGLTNATAIGANATVGSSNALILGGTGANAVAVGIGTETPYNDYAVDVETVNSNGIINGGVVVNASGGNLYLGMTNTVHKFRVDTNGAVYADGGLFSSGADFAESVEVRGDRAQYEPGDVLAIDRSADRHLALSHHSYETLVAGIYSTKPGVLASPHHIDDPSIPAGEVPLAVVGIVPCKVTTENGAIQPGDLLVTSSRPGYAMKGTDRKLLVGAVVGKALEPFSAGTGKIQILVTLQ